MIIAIDGPAGSGKSSTARETARRLGFLYIDTGAMYRAVGLGWVRRRSGGSKDTPAEVAHSIEVRLEPTASGNIVRLDGEDVTTAIRSEVVSEAASKVASDPSVREQMVAMQRKMAADFLDSGAGVVIEGRDIGTVVFPEAELKIFLTADVRERARRRAGELQADGQTVNEKELEDRLGRRDDADRKRAVAPLRKAEDAVIIDTTDLSFDEQVDRVVSLTQQVRQNKRNLSSLVH